MSLTAHEKFMRICTGKVHNWEDRDFVFCMEELETIDLPHYKLRKNRKLLDELYRASKLGGFVSLETDLLIEKQDGTVIGLIGMRQIFSQTKPNTIIKIALDSIYLMEEFRGKYLAKCLITELTEELAQCDIEEIIGTLPNYITNRMLSDLGYTERNNVMVYPVLKSLKSNNIHYILDLDMTQSDSMCEDMIPEPNLTGLGKWQINFVQFFMQRIRKASRGKRTTFLFKKGVTNLEPC
jgi:hypothetical protein